MGECRCLKCMDCFAAIPEGEGSPFRAEVGRSTHLVQQAAPLLMWIGIGLLDMRQGMPCLGSHKPS